MVNTKKCSKCGIQKELSEFYKDKKCKYGVKGNCKVCGKEYQKEYIQKNKEVVLQRNKEYRQNNREEIIQYNKEYRQNNREEISQQRKEYYQKNREEIIQKQMEYEKQRYHSDLNYRITECLRSRLWNALNGKTKSASTMELLGCTVEFLKEYLASQFQEGMSWDNYSFEVWHIDHIRPCSSFDLTDPEQQKQCFHYTNLQPLWAKDNISKGAKWENV